MNLKNNSTSWDVDQKTISWVTLFPMNDHKYENWGYYLDLFFDHAVASFKELKANNNESRGRVMAPTPGIEPGSQE